MMLTNPVSALYGDVIAAGMGASEADIMQQIIAAAAAWKPIGFDTQQLRRRHHYEDKGTTYIRAQLASAFPSSYESIPIIPFNWAQLHASVSASVYDEGVERYLEDDATDEKLDETDARAEAFEDLLEGARLDTVMAEAERIMHWAHNVVLAVRHRMRLVNGKLQRYIAIDRHWAHEVGVIPHPSAPTDTALASAWVVQVGSPDGVTDSGAVTWEVWTREIVDDEHGLPKQLGPWEVSVVEMRHEKNDVIKTRVVRPRAQYPSALAPFLLLTDRLADAMPWVDRGTDDVQVVEQLNADIADEAFIGHLQGHTDKVYKGNRKEHITGGPDKVIKIAVGEELQALDMNPKLTELRAANADRLRYWAMTKRHSPTAYAPDAQAPTSGVARQIENEPQEKMRREQVTRLQDFEEQQLLPALLVAHNVFVAPDTFTGVHACMRTSARPMYEDPDAKQRRCVDAKDAGFISEARAAFEAGWYDSVEDAVRAGLSDELGMKGSTPATSPFAQRLADMRGRAGAQVDTPPLEAPTDPAATE